MGYRAHVIHSNDATGPMIPMFVDAGLGQLGACGYLLTPHECNRNRLMIITTDAKVTYGEPIDYGIHAFLTGVSGLREPLPGPGPDA